MENIDWNLEGKTVTGLYLGSLPIKGKVDLSRVTYGGTVTHHIQLERSVKMWDSEWRNRVIVDHAHILTVE
jgi:hypothetical protein